MKGDRWLTQYSVLMIDEAHERTLNIDFILGLVKEILPHRPELKVIISSATLNPEVFRDYFTDCPIVSIDTPSTRWTSTSIPLPWKETKIF
jgi:ATP-dependent helicase HrpA